MFSIRNALGIFRSIGRSLWGGRGGHGEANDCGAREPKGRRKCSQKSDTGVGHSTKHNIRDSALRKGDRMKKLRSVPE